MAEPKTLTNALKIAEENPSKGTARQIINLSISIARSKGEMDKSIFSLYKEKINLSDKIFSKLKVIGEALIDAPEADLREATKHLPASYNSLHLLFSNLSFGEIQTGIKGRCITKDISYRKTNNYVKQIKHPAIFATDGDKGRWSIKEEHIWSITRREEITLEGKALEECEASIRKICKEYNLDLRRAKDVSVATIRGEERRVKAAFWRKRLEELVTHKWFAEQKEKVKKQFNVKTVEEVIDAPLRTFTGFLICCGCGKKKFFDIWGKAYISKVHLLEARATDAANRYNYRRTIEKKLGEKDRELAIWTNTVLKNYGLI